MSDEPIPYEDSFLYRIRHSAAHVMAQAVMELFPEGKIAIGPPISDGFYYDFDLPHTLTPEDLEVIEERMRQVIKGKHQFKRKAISGQEAREIFHDQPYKIELIEGLMSGGFDEYGNPSDEAPEITVYEHDSFTDLCRGPHLEHTGQLNPKAIKLMHVAGAYWRGDETRPMLQRIYGTAWSTPRELRQHLIMLEEAKKRDHRKLGRDLDLFYFEEEIGPGLPLWSPNGTAIIEEIEKLAHEMERKGGYQHVRTPHIAKEELYLKSGHLPYYVNEMYPPMEMEGVRYYLKPMNCPFHHKIFAGKPRSYRDMPLRLAEYGTCYRYEKSGQLMGLLRVRYMQMNDAHIYVTEAQFEEEFFAVIELYLAYFRLFGIDKYQMQLSTHSREKLGLKYVDRESLWLKTEDMVRQTMKNGQIPFVEKRDEAAFYGPKIDVEIWSAIGKQFTLATNQVDFAQPQRFDLKFINKNGLPENPLCLHRAPLSTHERLIGFLIEHYEGNFPTWLAPEQVCVIPITDAHNEYAAEVAGKLFDLGIRARADLHPERMNNKIRQAQLRKIPYMLIVGDAEMAAHSVSVRRRDGYRVNDLAFEDFCEQISEETRTRKSAW